MQGLVAGGKISSAELSEVIKKVKQEEGIKGNVIELLTLFCLSHKPLDFRTASAILDIPSNEIRLFFYQIQTVLVEKEKGEFTLFHNSFREYFFNHHRSSSDRVNRYENTIEATQNKIIEWCSHYIDHKNPYALRFYALHLWETKRFDELYVLASTNDFLEAQEQFHPSLSLDTIRLALKAAVENDRAGHIVKLCFDYARRAENLRSGSPLEILHRGSLEGALQIADLYEPKYRALWYFIIAFELFNTGHEDDVLPVLKKLLILGQRNPLLFNWEGEYLDEIVSRLIAWSDTDVLVALGNLLPSSDGRVIMALIRKQRFQEALQLIKNINNPLDRDFFKGTIAIHMVRVGDFKGAELIIDTIENPESRAYHHKVILETNVIETQFEESNNGIHCQY